MNRVEIERLHEVLRLDQASGKLFWKTSGKEAGGVVSVGQGRFYRRVSIDKVKLYVHRVIFAMRHGYWPKEIDHVNGDTLDCRPDNLIDAGQGVNMRNRAANKNESIYGRGVHIQKDTKGNPIYYRSSVFCDGKHDVTVYPIDEDKALLRAQIHTLKKYMAAGFSDRHIESVIKAIERNPDYETWDVRIEQIA